MTLGLTTSLVIPENAQQEMLTILHPPEPFIKSSPESQAQKGQWQKANPDTTKDKECPQRREKGTRSLSPSL